MRNTGRPWHQRGVIMKLCNKMILAAVLAAIMAVTVRAFPVQAAPAGYYRDQKVVYQNDGGMPDEAAYFRRMLGSIKNHIDAVGQGHVEIRVVGFGDGVDLLRMAVTDRDIAGRVDALRAQGVRFLVCANTLRGRNIDWHTLYGLKQDDIVPSGVAEIARLQGLGFVYLRV